MTKYRKKLRLLTKIVVTLHLGIVPEPNNRKHEGNQDRD